MKSQEQEGSMIWYWISSDNKLSARRHIQEKDKAGYLFSNPRLSNWSKNKKKSPTNKAEHVVNMLNLTRHTPSQAN